MDDFLATVLMTEILRSRRSCTSLRDPPAWRRPEGKSPKSDICWKSWRATFLEFLDPKLLKLLLLIVNATVERNSLYQFDPQPLNVGTRILFCRWVSVNFDVFKFQHLLINIWSGPSSHAFKVIANLHFVILVVWECRWGSWVLEYWYDMRPSCIGANVLLMSCSTWDMSPLVTGYILRVLVEMCPQVSRYVQLSCARVKYICPWSLNLYFLSVFFLFGLPWTWIDYLTCQLVSKGNCLKIQIF